MTATEKNRCQRCAGPIPPRTDPRGQRAKYCSESCRSAAYRARQRAKNAAQQADQHAELQALHEQYQGKISALEAEHARQIEGLTELHRLELEANNRWVEAKVREAETRATTSEKPADMAREGLRQMIAAAEHAATNGANRPRTIPPAVAETLALAKQLQALAEQLQKPPRGVIARKARRKRR